MGPSPTSLVISWEYFAGVKRLPGLVAHHGRRTAPTRVAGREEAYHLA